MLGAFSYLWLALISVMIPELAMKTRVLEAENQKVRLAGQVRHHKSKSSMV